MSKKDTKSKNLVIVESPAKAKTLKKFLGSSYKIEASMGHVRDLPKSELGINPDNDFEPKYITIRGKGELLAKLRKEAKAAKMVYLATDPDREGEAISWHLIHALKVEPEKTARITFNEITAQAVKKAVKEARAVDMNLVDAQQARRALDRVVGYKISPLLWKKVKKGLSAGRVQSVALKIICDREEEIENFIPEEYWTIEAILANAKKKQFEAKYHGEDGKKKKLTSKEDADKVLKAVEKGDFVVQDVKKSQRTRKPNPPFTTSTLQQEAGRELNFATRKTMMIAQQLYEGITVGGHGTVGLVTYIRTDSTRIADEAFTAGREYVVSNFGEAYALKSKPEVKAKRGSQDAHEAIRPSYVHLNPEEIKDSLSRDQYRLYRLIWRRFLASIMTPAIFDTVAAKIENNKQIFNATGSVLKFEGYKKVYLSKEDEEETGKALPELSVGEKLKLVKITPGQHFTQPPPRYSEASLVKALEENGVGRPSTYAPTISTITARGYVTKEQKALYPTELGGIVNNIMAEHFEQIVNIDFTANMEETLDRVEEGEIAWKDVMREFYPPFTEKLKIAEENIGEIEVRDEVTDIICENCGRNMVIKFGRYGRFLACPGFPDCRNAKPLFEDAGCDCPICKNGARVQIKKTKKGRIYYGCENNQADPPCEFMSWNRPTGQPCPRCGQPLVEKGTKKSKKIACADDKTCGYFTQAPEEAGD
ncbi:MAG: type I DNA topoisomerase [Clostridiales bacterium]|jgi:DNA topoisomerase-1|nr:type I DNA topoisomerase [Clostridiales bacterium]